MKSILEEIYKSGLKLLTPLTLGHTYIHIVEEAKKLVEADYGSIFLYQDRKLTRVYTTYPRLREVKIRPKGFTYTAFRRRQPNIVDIKYEAKVNPQIEKIGIRSDILVPLFYQNKSVGVLSLLSKKSDCFTSQHLDALKLFASMATLAILKAQAYDEIKNALDERDLFIQTAAHELRTPLTTITGYIQMLHSKLSGADTAESRWIDQLLWEADRLGRLVNELLTVGRIKAKVLQYTFRECRLINIIKRAISDIRFTYPDHQVAFENKVEDKKDLVIGDFDKLIQVIINLLENAAKFSPPNSQIFIKLEPKYRNLSLKISDQGPGIAKKHLKLVFNRFYRATTDQEGIGLGLYLAKNIIEHHRGTISISSKVHKGTTVEVKLPRHKG